MADLPMRRVDKHEQAKSWRRDNPDLDPRTNGEVEIEVERHEGSMGYETFKLKAKNPKTGESGEFSWVCELGDCPGCDGLYCGGLSGND